MRWIALIFALLLPPLKPALAQDQIGVAAPDDVIASGLMRHLLPRFSLKTGVRVGVDPSGAMVIDDGASGTPVFERNGTIYRLRIKDDRKQIRFKDWLTSEIGLRTVESFEPGDGAPFTAPRVVATSTEPLLFDGDATAGAALSLSHCGRCHVIGPQNAMNSIGSTPSFAALRAIEGWDVKFQTFYVLRPHGVFTQIDGVTEPFDPDIPSPIAPVMMSVDDLEAILAYVAQVEPADLGAPLQLQ